MTEAMRRPLPPPGGDLVTGEAVLLELRLAKLPSRGVAEMLDLLVQFGFLLFVSLVGALSGLSYSLDSAASGALALTLIIAVLVGYPVLFETLSRGRSLGKMAMGLRVVRDDGGPIRFRHALVRGLLAVFEIYPFAVVAIITSLVSTKGKRVGDFLAGTVVVRERVPGVAAPMVQMPPGLAGWATTLELSRLPDDLALTARQFMSRASALSPSVRNAMGGQIAHDVSRFVAPPPPAGCPPEPYLAAVLAERRRRDLARYGSPSAGPGSAGPGSAGPGSAGPGSAGPGSAVPRTAVPPQGAAPPTPFAPPLPVQPQPAPAPVDPGQGFTAPS
jgi:uncharacterized RDD family membrane protein YckC